MSEYLCHHGVKGQKWGERKYQYKDGSLTPEGRRRYGVLGSTKAYIKQRRKNVSKFYKESKNLGDDKTRGEMTEKERAIYDKAQSNYKRRQANAGERYRADLKKGFDDKASRLKKSLSDSKQARLKKQAKRGRMFSWDQMRNTGIRAVQGEVVARETGKLLIKRATKNNPNLKLSDSDVQRLIKQAGTFGRNAGVAYSRFETAQGYAARKKLYGDPIADPWVSEHSVLNKRKK